MKSSNVYIVLFLLFSIENFVSASFENNTFSANNRINLCLSLVRDNAQYISKGLSIIPLTGVSNPFNSSVLQFGNTYRINDHGCLIGGDNAIIQSSWDWQDVKIVVASFVATIFTLSSLFNLKRVIESWYLGSSSTCCVNKNCVELEKSYKDLKKSYAKSTKAYRELNDQLKREVEDLNDKYKFYIEQCQECVRQVAAMEKISQEPVDFTKQSVKGRERRLTF